MQKQQRALDEAGDLKRFGDPVDKSESAFEWDNLLIDKDEWICPETMREQVHALFRQAIREAGVHHSDKAHLLLSKAIYLAPNDPSLHVVIADLVLSVGDIKSAIVHLRRASNLEHELEESAQRQGLPEIGSHPIRYKLSGALDCFGTLEYKRGAYSSALAYFSDAIAMQEPVSAAVFLHRAMAHLQLGNWAMALSDLEHARFLAPATTEQLVLQAKVCELVGRSEDSLNCFRDAESLTCDHVEVRAFRDRVDENTEAVYREASKHMLSHDFNAAKNALQSILQVNKDPKALLLLAAVCRALGEYSEGLQHLAVASDLHAQTSEKRRMSTDRRRLSCDNHERKIRQERNRAANASAAANNRRMHSSTSSPSRRNAVTNDNTNGETADTSITREEFSDQIEDSIEKKEAHSGEQQQEEEKEKEQDTEAEKTIHEYRDLIREPPELVKQRCLIFNDMALVEIERGELSAAVLLLNRALSTQRHQPQALPVDLCRSLHVNRGDCYRGLGKLPLALSDYHSAMETHPHAAHIRTRISVVHNSRGVELCNAGEIEEAEREFIEAIAYNDSVAEYHFNMGVMREDQGDSKGAFKCYTRALRLDSDHLLAKTRMSQFQ